MTRTLPTRLLTMAAAALMAQGALAAVKCEANLDGTSEMKYSSSEIKIPASCMDFTIKFTNKSKNNTQYNVVIANKENVGGISPDGMLAGAKFGFIKEADSRVIAHSSLVGPGEKTEVTFPVSRINGTSVFFSSFPGQGEIVQGNLVIIK